jgi:hypothetical protein
MGFFVKVIPPSKRARVHRGDCTHCNNGGGQENQDKSGSPTYWIPAPPNAGMALSTAVAEMEKLTGYQIGRCYYCEKSGKFAI